MCSAFFCQQITPPFHSIRIPSGEAKQALSQAVNLRDQPDCGGQELTARFESHDNIFEGFQDFQVWPI